jgi:hypothetical protein
MDDFDLTLPPELETALHEFYAMPEPQAAFAARLEAELRRRQVDLPQPAANPRLRLWLERNTFMQTLRARPALMILLVLLGLILLTGVVYAVGRSLGYIPGVGLVDQEQDIRILSTPVSDNHDGMSVMVKKVVADSTRTFITFSLSGFSQDKNGFPICIEPATLQLPDGRKLEYLSGGGGGGEAQTGAPLIYETSYTFSPIPAGIKTVSLLLPCDRPAITLQLVPAPADFVTPAVEVGATYEASVPNFASAVPETPVGATETGAATAVAPQPSGSAPDGTSAASSKTGLHLEKVLELKDSYILIGNFTDGGDLPGSLDTSPYDLAERVRITDGSGRYVHFDARYDIQPDVAANGVDWAYEIRKPVEGPLTITLALIYIQREYRAQFPLDIGQNPQAGQVLDINQAIKLGPYDFMIDKVVLAEKNFSLNFHSDSKTVDGYVSVDLPSTSSDGGYFYEVHNSYRQVWPYQGLDASGKLNLKFSLSQSDTLKGPWTLTWSPSTGK